MNKIISNILIQEQVVLEKIYHIRDQKVMLDLDLAVLYEVETRVLKKVVKRNIQRFPDDFMFQLTKRNGSRLSQFVITSQSRQNSARQPLRIHRTGHSYVIKHTQQ